MFNPTSLAKPLRVSVARLAVWLFLGAGFSAAAGTKSPLTFCCENNNDLFLALEQAGAHCPRFSSVTQALNSAPPDSAVLVLADQYPVQTTRIDPSDFELASNKNLHLYLEYPTSVPGLELGKPQTTEWERGIVASDDFGPALPRLRILAIHDCHYTPAKAAHPMLVVGRVAGFDTAVYGLPATAQPLLFEIPGRNIFVATTKLSGFITGRYAPARDWQAVWQTILARLDPQHAPHKLTWLPIVSPAFGPETKLPPHFEKSAFSAFANWITNSRLLVPPDREAAIASSLKVNGETAATPGSDEPIGDGSLGILEGYASGIRFDGGQIQRLPLRDDCNSECAMILALDAMLNHHRQSRTIASNLLDYVFFNSDMCRGARSDPKNGAYGLIGWGAISPAWLVANYGDDNARGLLGVMAVSACLHNDRWDEALLRALLANLRTTGKLGFRGDRIDVPDLAQQGWKPYHDASNVNYSPHFESYLWACDLWAYRQTGLQPFLNKATNAIAMTMKVYPVQWRWQDNMERARMLLCLSWLVRLEDTPEHRQWVQLVAGDLLKHQAASGAIHEWLGGTGGGHYRIPQSNEAYGTGETPLIQQNGDPASDQLYTTGFALLGLHEAVAATGDKSLKNAEDKLAKFLCRIQVRSEKIPYLNGTWFRAFDDRRWEFWSSSADIGWGAWSVESGWGQAWTATVLALRQKGTTFWDLTANPRIKNLLPSVEAQMSMRDEDF